MQKRRELLNRTSLRAIRKRGLSNIVGTVLIVLLGLAAVGIIWAILSPILSEGGEGIGTQSSLIGVRYAILDLEATEEKATFLVERKAGSSVVAGFVTVVTDTTGKKARIDDHALESVSALEAVKSKFSVTRYLRERKICPPLICG